MIKANFPRDLNVYCILLISRQVWYLIVSLLDLCRVSYFNIGFPSCIEHMFDPSLTKIQFCFCTMLTNLSNHLCFLVKVKRCTECVSFLILFVWYQIKFSIKRLIQLIQDGSLYILSRYRL